MCTPTIPKSIGSVCNALFVKKVLILHCFGLVGLFCLMTPGLSRDIRCHV